jgi:DNA-binding NarL/FixJ family response regulator
VLGQDAISAVVFEDVRGMTTRTLGAAVAVFVYDSFLSDMKRAPSFWAGTELVNRIGKRTSPVLTDREVRESNSNGGLNLVVWQSSVSLEDSRRAEIWHHMVTAFLEEHRGFLLKELIAQAESIEHLIGMRNAGALFFSYKDGEYGEFPDHGMQEVIRQPHVIGHTRSSAIGQIGSWIGSLFIHNPPKICFSRSEQRLLLAARHGETDEELAERLGISLSATKKTWHLIYERVEQHAPHLIPNRPDTDRFSSDRGREKKQRLIAYVREHPEELRPVLRKLLERYQT